MTRFIALASVGNPAKAKSLHALALTPAADMDIAVLTQRPDGTTPCPYELPNSSKRALNGQDDDTGGQVLLCTSCQSCFAILPMFCSQARPYLYCCIRHEIYKILHDYTCIRVTMSVWPVDAELKGVMSR